MDATARHCGRVVFHFSADILHASRDIAPLVIDPAALQMVLGVLTGWLDRREREAIAYLIEENRLLRRQLGGRGCVLRTTIAVGWPRECTESAVRSYGRSPPSRRPTPCCGGIGNYAMLSGSFDRSRGVSDR